MVRYHHHRRRRHPGGHAARWRCCSSSHCSRADRLGRETVVNRYVWNTSAIGTTKAEIQNILLEILPAVASVKAVSTSDNPFVGPGSDSSQVVASGTGMIVSANGQVITNDHVVNGASSVPATLNGSTTEHRATIVGGVTAQAPR